MGRNRSILFSVFAVVIIILWKVIFHCHLDLTDDDFTSVEFCPACYGSSLCPHFYHGEILLIGFSKLKYLQFINVKNVYDGKLLSQRVILKKLAHNWEITETDKLLCKKSNLSDYCTANKAMENIIKNAKGRTSNMKLSSVLKFLNSSTDISQCPSERLLSYIFNKVNNKQGDVLFEHMELYKIGEIMYSLLLNPEAVILQAFSQTEGWPFPHYYGACGRVIVEEYVGKRLSYFVNSPWKHRIDIGYQLLQIAQMLTENILDFALYMTDVNMDNFAVRPDGTVFLIDVENIVIVDRLEAKGKNVDRFHQSIGGFCKDCLSFSFDDLCNHDLSDHNYYAICKGILAPNAYYFDKGLLYGIPSNIDTQTNLSVLLKECADPSMKLGRFHVVPKILQVMKSLL